MTRTINKAGMDIVEHYEGLRLTAYQDVVGIWTIGYGHTRDVHPGDTITEEQAAEYLRDDLMEAEGDVSALVRVPLNDNQFSALVSLVFNIGAGKFKNSTLLHFLNQGEYYSAANEFKKWDNAGGHVEPGLVARRDAEFRLFQTLPEVA